MEKKELYIVGAGSVGGHIAINLEEYSHDYKLIGFLDDDPSKIGKECFGYPVVGNSDSLLKLSEVAVVIGIAFPAVKKKIIDKLSQNESLEFPTLVARQAWVSKQVTLGQGAVIYPGVSINYGTSIGEFVVINMNCALGHDCVIGNYSSLAPGVHLGGHTCIGEASEMGIGSSTLQGVKIGAQTIVGGQSMVVSNLSDNITVKGIPAREK